MVVVKKEKGRDRHDKAATGENDLQLFIDRILSMPKRRLYLNDEEYQYATLCLNGMRNDYLAADRSCGGIDRLLLKLVRASYRSIVSR